MLGSFVGMVLFVLVGVIMLLTPLAKTIKITQGVDLFVLSLIAILISAIILTWILDFLVEKLRIEVKVLTLCEYMIQWSLIYVTVYQVVFEKFLSKQQLVSLANINIFNPDHLVILLLPALMIYWISVILYKVKSDNL